MNDRPIPTVEDLAKAISRATEYGPFKTWEPETVRSLAENIHYFLFPPEPTPWQVSEALAGKFNVVFDEGLDRPPPGFVGPGVESESFALAQRAALTAIAPDLVKELAERAVVRQSGVTPIVPFRITTPLGGAAGPGVTVEEIVARLTP